MKKPIKISRFVSDVLIIDNVGSDVVIKCIPAELSYSIVDVRNGIPYIARLFFFFRLSIRVAQFGIKYKSVIASIVDVIKPKIIISYIDTNLIMGQIGLIFPNKLVISIQNGTRLHMGGFNNKREFLLPHYFTFGEYEKDLLKKYNIKYQSCKAVGSVKLGLFLEKNPRVKNDRSGICFVSQYVPSSNKFKDDGVKRLKSLYSNLINWSNEYDRRIVRIAMRNNKNDSDYLNELNFFKLSSGIDIKLVDNVDYSSYEAGYESLVIVTIDSTIGFELFGSGKRVLFCGTTIGDEFLEKENIDYIFRKMPDIVLLDNLTQKEFDNKMNALIRMKNEEYLSQTKEAREYYMKCQTLPPHKVISEFILDNVQI
mgnify:FL=1